MQAVILAGGLATRLYPLTKKIPKSLISIWGKPFLQYQLELLRKSEIKDIVLCVGYLGKKIKNFFGNGEKFGVKLHYSEEKRLLGTAGALKNAEKLLEKEFFVVYGDSYVPVNYQKVMRYFAKYNELGLTMVYHNFDLYDRSNIILEGNLVKEYCKNPKKKKKGMDYIDAGVNFFRKEVLGLIPRGREIDLNRIQAKLARKRQLLAYETKERFYEVGSPKGLEEFKNYIQETKNK